MKHYFFPTPPNETPTELRLKEIENRLVKLERETELGYDNPLPYSVWVYTYDGHRYHTGIRQVVEKLLEHIGLELTHIPETKSNTKLTAKGNANENS